MILLFKKNYTIQANETFVNLIHLKLPNFEISTTVSDQEVATDKKLRVDMKKASVVIGKKKELYDSETSMIATIVGDQTDDHRY